MNGRKGTTSKEATPPRTVVDTNADAGQRADASAEADGEVSINIHRSVFERLRPSDRPWRPTMLAWTSAMLQLRPGKRIQIVDLTDTPAGAQHLVELGLVRHWRTSETRYLVPRRMASAGLEVTIAPPTTSTEIPGPTGAPAPRKRTLRVVEAARRSGADQQAPTGPDGTTAAPCEP